MPLNQRECEPQEADTIIHILEAILGTSVPASCCGAKDTRGQLEQAVRHRDSTKISLPNSKEIGAVV